eukprot:4171073-Pyramimonas_sp.AAC.1
MSHTVIFVWRGYKTIQQRAREALSTRLSTPAPAYRVLPNRFVQRGYVRAHLRIQTYARIYQRRSMSQSFVVYGGDTKYNALAKHH